MLTVSKLNKEIFTKDIKCVSLGKLSSEVAEFILKKRPDLTDIISAKQEIIFWANRVAHTERHKNDFMSDVEYQECFEKIQEIIQKPDYISIHPKDDSISFIKEFSAHISVAVRISGDGKLSYRTIYPLMDAQLSHYIDKGRAWKYLPDKNI